LHEDKRYYPDLEQVYPEAETLIMEEDAQHISVPIVQPFKPKNFEKIEREIPETWYPIEFLKEMMNQQERIRNIAIIGHLHHGKTILCDILIEQAHKDFASDPEEPMKYLDSRKDEISREISMKASPISLILQDSRDKSYLINIIDTPGHPNFSDEASAGLALCDGVFIVVDAVEGVMINTEQLLRHALQSQLPVILVLNKIDRFVLELKIPPQDTYYKLKHTLDELNMIVQTYGYHKKFSPVEGNVIFASGLFGFTFTLESMAKKYADMFGHNFDTKEFAKRLWGNLYFDPTTRRFCSQPAPGKSYGDRSFVEFVMQPLYKILGYSASEEKENLEKLLKPLGVYIKKQCYDYNTKTLIKIICRTFFGKPDALVDLSVANFPAPHKSNRFEKSYPGPQTGESFLKIKKSAKTGPCVVHITKQYHNSECDHFYLFGRVISGSLSVNDSVFVLGEKFSLKDPEQRTSGKIEGLYVNNTRYKVPLETVPAGNFVMIEGLDCGLSKTCTIISPELNNIFPSSLLIKYTGCSTVKIAIEPLNPAELPKMLEGLRKCSKSYPLLEVKVQETGEHMIIGTGELYMDNVLHDLRNLYTDIEIKLSDPSVILTETVIDTSSFKSFAQTPNNMNKITVIAEPLEAMVACDIQSHKVYIHDPGLARVFEEKYNWDVLASNNIWAFGPDDFGPNVFINDILPYEQDRSLLDSKSSIVQGFQWACKEGPLCEEPIRGVKFRMVECLLSSESIYKASGQLIPAARRVCYSSFLLATPRLMEPYNLVEILCTKDCLPAVYTLLQRRRGHINSEEPKPGSPHYILLASMPVIDSFGFETDLRTYTSGMAFSVSIFDKWALVPGDPLDRKIQLRPLEPSPAPHLARDFMLKTRRRKGLTEDITITKYFDNPVLYEMAKEDQDLSAYF
jgi:116 kDa U5 small nuclear ribonucleoprotein component